MELLDSRGHSLARNEYDLILYADPRPPTAVPLAWSGTSALMSTLSRAGYKSQANANAGAVMIAERWTEDAQRFAESGGRAILLLDSADALPANFAVQLKTRERNNYNGDWISNFNWILPSSPVFNEIAFNKIMGWEAQAVTPDYVLLGVPADNFDDVLAGAFYGWINANSALMLQARYGTGRVLLTTYRFDEYGKDPYATALLDNMIRHAASEQFGPKFNLR